MGLIDCYFCATKTRLGSLKLSLVQHGAQMTSSFRSVSSPAPSSLFPLYTSSSSPFFLSITLSYPLSAVLSSSPSSSLGSVVLSCCPGTRGSGNVTIDVTLHSVHSHGRPGVIGDITRTRAHTHTLTAALTLSCTCRDAASTNTQSTCST